MDTEVWRPLLLLAGAGLGYVVLMTTNPVRGSLREGFRCLRRHRQIWVVPAVFAIAHADFEAWLHLQGTSANASPQLLQAWQGWHPPPLLDVLPGSLLPAAESTSAIFNCVSSTFPLSTVGALLFLGNWQRSQMIVWRGLRTRCGMLAGSGLHLLVVCSALAALCKPAIFYLLSTPNAYFNGTTLLRSGEWINTFSVFFEYLLGVSVQTYLLVLAYAWVRGLTFDIPGLRRFALRRFASVLKWAVVILCLTALGINLPLIIASWRAPGADWQGAGFLTGVRWLLCALLLLFCSMQILLALHNDSLQSTVIQAVRCWRLHGPPTAWLMSVAALHFLLLAFVDNFLPQALGASTWPANTWGLLIFPVLWSGLAGWFLASWVCLFRRFEGYDLEGAELIRSWR